MDVTTERHSVVTDRAPRPFEGAPYSQAIAARGLVFCSGQVPLDAATGRLAGDDIESQTHAVFANLAAVLEAAGSSLADICKTTVFLTSLDDFSAMNEVYGSYFDREPPARSTVEVSKLPAGARVEIEAIAFGE